MLSEITLAGLKGILPEIIILFAGLISLLIGAFSKQNSAKFIASLMIAAAKMAVILLIYFFKNNYNEILVPGFFLNNEIIIAKIILYSLFILIILLYLADFDSSNNIYKFEYVLLMAFCLLGMSIMLSANNFMVLYIGLELQSLCLYLLAVFDRNSISQSEAGVKYLILGALASGIFLYGVSLVYGFTGSIDFNGLVSNQIVSNTMSIGAVIGFILIIITFCFKISAAPFHMWAPDVIEGTSTQAALFISSLAKFASIIVLQYQILSNLADHYFNYKQIITMTAVLSLIVGSIGGIRQMSIKRLFAYSSIANMGFILLGFMTEAEAARVNVINYLIIYMLTTIGFFAIILSLRFKGVYNDSIYAFKGLATKRPYFTALASIIIFSMVGIPPLAGFFAKFYILRDLISRSALTNILAIIAVSSAVISAFYYLRIIKFMYADEANETIDEPKRALSIIVLLTALFCITYIIFAGQIAQIFFK